MIQLQDMADVVRSEPGGVEQAARTLLADRVELEEGVLDRIKSYISKLHAAELAMSEGTSARKAREGHERVDKAAADQKKGEADLKSELETHKANAERATQALGSSQKSAKTFKTVAGVSGVAALAMAAALGIPRLKRALVKKHEDRLQKEANTAQQQQQPGDTPLSVQGVPAVAAAGQAQPPQPEQQQQGPTVLHVHHTQPFAGPAPEPPNPPPAPSIQHVGPTITRRPQVAMPTIPAVYTHPIYGQTARVYNSLPMSQMPRVPMGQGFPGPSMPSQQRMHMPPRSWG